MSVERASAVDLKPTEDPLRPCACGDCEEFVSRGGNGRLEYAPGHRQRGYRKRVKAAMVASGLPAYPSLQVARMKGTINKRNGDAQKSGKRRQTRNGDGVRLYISTAEAEALLRGEIRDAVKRKVAAKLKPADPIPGQQSIYDVLTEEHDASATAESEAPAS